MKTAKDFILKHWNPEIIPGECEVKHFFDEMDRVMQLYSDQQNKEKDDEIQRLTNEVEELKDKWENDRDDCIEKLNKESAEIQRLTKELEKAMEAPNIDEEAHNYAASKIWIDKRDVEIQTPPVHEFHEYIANKSFKAGAECMMPQLTRLTKEVEQLRANNYDLAVESQERFEELTRLRELLRRIKKVAGNDWNRYYAGLSKDIDNALNHKP